MLSKTTKTIFNRERNQRLIRKWPFQ